MKIIYLNTWFNNVKKPLAEFIKTHSATTDVFCFSEVSNGKSGMSFGDVTGTRPVGEEFRPLIAGCASDSFSGLSKMLPGFEGRFDVSGEINVKGQKGFPVGLALFIKKGLKIEEQDVVDINVNAPDDPEGYERIMQYACLRANDRKIWINNFHGMSSPWDKKDSEGRIKQSKRICEVLSGQKGAKILGGDFNLFPDTKSIGMFRDGGFVDLIQEFEISNTRGDLNFSQWPDSKQYFADYIFVSRDLKIKSFSVPNISISDHLPLILEIK